MEWRTIFFKLLFGPLLICEILGHIKTDSTFKIQTTKRTQTGFPPNLQIVVTSPQDVYFLEVFDLRKSTVNANAPMFRVCGNGLRVCREGATTQDVVYYEDVSSGSSLSVIQQHSSNGRPQYVWGGNIVINGTQYDIQDISTSGSPDVLYTLIAIPDLPGLTDFTYFDPQEIQRDNLNRNRNPYRIPQKRRKRQIRSVLGVELLVVIDNVIFQKWYDTSTANTDILRVSDTEDKLRRYFAHVVNGMDLRYRAIKDSRFQIHITLSGYVMGQGDVTLPVFANDVTKVAIDADKTLGLFRNWVRETDGLPAFDHAMLFTGHDIFTVKRGIRTDSVTGLAYMGLICTKSSVSIVEYHGGFSSARIATHELGHSLGAEHDGDNNMCKASNQYIMTSKDQPTNDPRIRQNPWQFSQCSLDSFSNMVNTLKTSSSRQCLFDAATHFNQRQWDTYTNQHPGQMFDIDDICRQYFGSASYMCRDLMKSQDEICTTLWCSRPNTNQCRQHVPPRGTSCGDHKWCIDGACVWDSRAPVRTGNCVHGSHPGIVHNGRTCKQMVTEEPYYCYQDFISKRCCIECNAYYVPIKGCEYGNRQKKCPEEWCSYQGAKREQILSQCCGTCNVGTPIIPTTYPPGSRMTSYTTQLNCNDVAANCHNIVARFPTRCYIVRFERECCSACRNIRSGNSDCLYGDRDPPTCDPVVLNLEKCQTSKMAQYNCCGSCAAIRRKHGVGFANTSRVYLPLLVLVLFLHRTLFV